LFVHPTLREQHDEQQRLSRARIGVIGLSVGNMATVTCAPKASAARSGSQTSIG